jgi:hypothetical protein
MGIEKQLGKKLYSNLGIHATYEEPTHSSNKLPKLYWVPSANINWRF